MVYVCKTGESAAKTGFPTEAGESLKTPRCNLYNRRSSENPRTVTPLTCLGGWDFFFQRHTAHERVMQVATIERSVFFSSWIEFLFAAIFGAFKKTIRESLNYRRPAMLALPPADAILGPSVRDSSCEKIEEDLSLRIQRPTRRAQGQSSQEVLSSREGGFQPRHGPRARQNLRICRDTRACDHKGRFPDGDRAGSIYHVGQT